MTARLPTEPNAAFPAAATPEHHHPPWLDALADGCLVLDRAPRVVYCNPAFAAALGRPATDLLGKDPEALLPGFAASAAGRVAAETLASGRVREADESAGGRHYHLRAHPVPDGVLVLRSDITPRRQLEEELLHAALDNALVLAQLPTVHWAVDAGLRLTRSAGAGLTGLGLSEGEVVGRTLAEYFGTDDPDFPSLAAHRRALAGESVRYQQTHAGRHFEVALEPLRGPDGTVRGVVGLAHDVTEWARGEEERERLRQQVYQAQKQESLGLLAGGVAHDFGNLLAAVLHSAELLLRDLPPASPQGEAAELIRKATAKAAGLTRQMLAFAGKGMPRRRQLDLNEVVREAVPLWEASRPAGVRFDAALADALPPVHADAGQMQQVLLNLLSNASEALAGRGGTVTLRTGAEGPCVLLEVADDGPGMTPEVRARAFDPFFTTRGRGRGLGLSAAQGIVRAHQGAVELASEPGRGTTFRVRLPAGLPP